MQVEPATVKGRTGALPTRCLLGRRMPIAEGMRPHHDSENTKASNKDKQMGGEAGPEAVAGDETWG